MPFPRFGEKYIFTSCKLLFFKEKCDIFRVGGSNIEPNQFIYFQLFFPQLSFSEQVKSNKKDFPEVFWLMGKEQMLNTKIGPSPPLILPLLTNPSGVNFTNLLAQSANAPVVIL